MPKRKKKLRFVFYLPSDHHFCLLEMGSVTSPSSTAKSLPPLASAGVWWVKFLPSKEFLKSSQSLFNKSQNQWTATAYYRILSEKCVLLLSARRYRARDVSLSSTLDFVSERAASLPSALGGSRRRFCSGQLVIHLFITLAGPGPSVRNTVSVWSLNPILRVLLVTLEICLCTDQSRKTGLLKIELASTVRNTNSLHTQKCGSTEGKLH